MITYQHNISRCPIAFVAITLCCKAVAAVVVAKQECTLQGRCVYRTEWFRSGRQKMKETKCLVFKATECK